MSEPDLPAPIPAWLAYLEEQGKATRTVQGYAADLRDFCAWNLNEFGEEVEAATVLPRDIEDYKYYLQTGRRAAPRTINHRLAALSRFFKWALARGLVAHDPTAEVRAVRLPPRRPKSLTRQEERRLRRAVEHAGDRRDVAILEVFLGTGLRVGELLALRRGDIVLKERASVLTVRRGKGGGMRRVPLTAEVRKAVQAYLERLAVPLNDDAPLWQGARGPLHDPSAINRLLAKYAHLAKIDGLSPHTLRHTFATRYLEANPSDLRGLASLLGHSSLNTVMIYTEPTEEDLLDRMEQMGVADVSNGAIRSRHLARLGPARR